MATQSRARMFHATAKALNNAASQRNESIDLSFLGNIQGASPNIDERQLPFEELESLPLPVAEKIDVSPDDMRAIHAEFRWADSKLMQASERLAEAQEKQRKDLVALACMRRELKTLFEVERSWLAMQNKVFEVRAESAMAREAELAELVEAGVQTEAVIHELALVRAEHKLNRLASAQVAYQLARIAENESALDFDVANEAYDLEPDGKTMRELARLRALKTKTRRDATGNRSLLAESYEKFGIDRSIGEVTAISSFMALEFEGDARGAERARFVRRHQAAIELLNLPEPTSEWKNGLRHPMTWMKARRTTAPTNQG